MKAFSSLTSVSFDAHGAVIERACAVHARITDAADLRRDGVITKELNLFIDRVRAIPGAETRVAIKVAREAIKGDAHIVALIEGDALSRATLAAYLTGVTRALTHGVPWAPGLHKDPQYAGAERKGAPAGAKPTEVSAVKWDAKARVLSATLPKAVEGSAIAKTIAAIVGDPARVALFLAWAKAHEWVK